ncbi:hypothetical protein [Ruoffia sp. FAM 26254]|uniref:hypothetical protein n=1 Tax=Ruoffia sp. FAM 26254 TaxID=3259518 RepID=UPI0038877C7A
METYFTIKRGKLATAIFLIIGLIFTWYGATFSFILFPMLGQDDFDNQLSIIAFIPLIFLIIGLVLLGYSIYSIVNATYVTASKDTIQYHKEIYDVSRIHRFVYCSRFIRRKRGNDYTEEIIIEGEDGAMIMNITNKNMRTKKVLELIREHYPNIPLIMQ